MHYTVAYHVGIDAAAPTPYELVAEQDQEQPGEIQEEVAVAAQARDQEFTNPHLDQGKPRSITLLTIMQCLLYIYMCIKLFRSRLKSSCIKIPDPRVMTSMLGTLAAC